MKKNIVFLVILWCFDVLPLKIPISQLKIISRDDNQIIAWLFTELGKTGDKDEAVLIKIFNPEYSEDKKYVVKLVGEKPEAGFAQETEFARVLTDYISFVHPKAVGAPLFDEFYYWRSMDPNRALTDFELIKADQFPPGMEVKRKPTRDRAIWKFTHLDMNRPWLVGPNNAKFPGDWRIYSFGDYPSEFVKKMFWDNEGVRKTREQLPLEQTISVLSLPIKEPNTIESIYLNDSEPITQDTYSELVDEAQKFNVPFMAYQVPIDAKHGYYYTSNSINYYKQLPNQLPYIQESVTRKRVPWSKIRLYLVYSQKPENNVAYYLTDSNYVERLDNPYDLFVSLLIKFIDLKIKKAEKITLENLHYPFNIFINDLKKITLDREKDQQRTRVANFYTDYFYHYPDYLFDACGTYMGLIDFLVFSDLFFFNRLLISLMRTPRDQLSNTVIDYLITKRYPQLTDQIKNQLVQEAKKSGRIEIAKRLGSSVSDNPLKNLGAQLMQLKNRLARLLRNLRNFHR